MSGAKLLWKAVGSTDIGGGRENQDECFVWENVDRGIMVAGVLDGHGRDVGKVAAVVGKNFLMQYCEENQSVLFSDPYQFLVKGISEAHQAIKQGFFSALKEKGFEVKEVDGYLVKRRAGKSQWLCVHGGSSCSLVAIVGTKMYTGNVGDSTGIMCASRPVLCESMLKFVGDAGDPERKVSSIPNGGNEMSNTLVITADHSPESHTEFCRMRSFRPRDGDPTQPSLLVVYDASQQDKSRCPDVFKMDKSGIPQITNRGSYYKNVRREWASLVAAPSSAKYQDALAFTRSIGDFHLHKYGVTELAEVQCIDLKPIIESLVAEGAYRNVSTSSTPNSKPTKTLTKTSSGRSLLGAGRISPMDSQPNTNGIVSQRFDMEEFPSICVVLASDGIWDNWEYHDVTDFVMNPSHATGGTGTGVELAAQSSRSLIECNSIQAKQNFGNQADNATGIVMFIQPDRKSVV